MGVLQSQGLPLQFPAAITTILLPDERILATTVSSCLPADTAISAISGFFDTVKVRPRPWDMRSSIHPNAVRKKTAR